MSFPKKVAICAVVLISVVGIISFFRGGKTTRLVKKELEIAPVEVQLDREIRMAHRESTLENKKECPIDHSPLPEGDRIEQLFSVSGKKLPIVQTIVYKSRVPWQKGRPAWISDYASHYSTSRHFIARSLNGKADYFKQDVSEGDRFNVLNPEKNISFYLLIDTSRSRLWFYYLDLDSNERVLLKTYPVGLGRLDSSKPSGMLTPLGKYTLGNKVAIYKPKTTGFHSGQKTEMIRVFGTRWIPFDKEAEGATAPSEGLGLHGVPWLPNAKGELVENVESLGKYESDGGIRLSTSDIEELYAIIISRPTTVELVKDFYEASLPGTEKDM